MAYGQFNNVWPVGKMQGIDFNGPQAKIIRTGINNDSTSTPLRYNSCYSASICDCNGNLLFYTNGVDIWNKYDSLMDNGHLKFSNRTSTTGMNRNCIIVPIPGNNQVLYYVFYVSHNNFNTPWYNKLNMALVDMSANSGQGTVVFKDSVVNDNVVSSTNLTYALHQNGNDYWIICSKDKDSLYAFLIDQNGLNRTPVPSKAYSQVITNMSHPLRYGFIKLSNDYSKLFVSGLDIYNSPNGQVIRYDFDRNTGRLTNETIIISQTDYPKQAVRSFCFSPNDSLVYFCMQPDSGYTGPWFARILQYNRFTGQKSFVYQWKRPSYYSVGATPITRFSINAGPDDKAYILLLNQIYRINFPDRNSNACNVKYWDSLYWMEYGNTTPNYDLTVFSLPNAFNYYHKLFFNVKETPGACTDSTTFTYYGDSSYYKLIWHFGDGDSLVQYPPFRYGSSFKHAYRSDGLYPVTLVSWHPTCNHRKDYTDTISVKLNPKVKAFALTEKNRACYGDTLQLSLATDSSTRISISWGDNLSDSLLSDGRPIRVHHVFLQEDTFALRLTFKAKNLCAIDSNGLFISVFNPKPVQLLKVSGYERLNTSYGMTEYTGCDSLRLRFIDSSSGTGILNSYSWGPGDSLSVAGMIPVYKAFGNDSQKYFTRQRHTVRSTNGFGCSAMDTFITRVYARPVTGFKLDTLFACLRGNTFHFNNTTTFSGPEDSLLYGYQIDQLRASGLPGPAINFSRAGKMKILLNARSLYGCSDSSVLYVKVAPNPVSLTEKLGGPVQCLSGNNLKIQLKNIERYEVLWGDSKTSDTAANSNGAILNHTYRLAGDYDITVIATDSAGCRDSSVIKQNIEAEPEPGFDLNDSDACFADNKFDIKTRTKALKPDSIENTIYFGNGWKYSQKGNFSTSYSYPMAGSYTMRLVSVSPAGCMDSVKKLVQIFNDPVYLLKSHDTCFGDSTLLTCSWNKGQKIKYLEWTSPNRHIKDSLIKGTSDALKFISGSSGTFPFTLTVTDSNGCRMSSAGTYAVYALPSVRLSFRRLDEDMDSLAYQFTDNSDNVRYRTWDFDGEAKAYGQVQKYNFKDTGYRKVTLYISDEHGCSDSGSVFIQVYPEFRFYFPNAVSANSDGINDVFGTNAPQFIQAFEMVIYDRWGGIVYSSNDKSLSWNPEVQGVYIYRIKLQDLYKTWHYYNGSVTVLK